MRAHAAAVSDGIPLELSSLLMPYGRERRVALRIERMPSRARLSRGRNNGDGSWSLNRDELEWLEYLPPKGATDFPTLMIRVVGLDSDNGTTLSVLDYPVLPGGADGEADGEESTSRRDELRTLRSELAKTKAALRMLQSEFGGSRKSFDAELEERLNEASIEAASALEERRAAWQAETSDRIAKAEARSQERLDQARKRWERDAEAGLSRAEESWKSAEAAKLAEAEARWREQSGRALAKETAQLKKIEAELAEARNRVASSTSNDAEFRRLHDEITKLQSEIAERDGQLADAQAAAAAEAREQSRRDLSAALSQAEEKWKATETRRRATAEAAWKELSDRAVEEVKHRLEQTETELLEARNEAKAARERRDSAETKRLRAELSNARQTIAVREKELAEAQSAADQAAGRTEELAVAISNAEMAWKKNEAKRLAAAETRWTEKSAQIVAEVSARLQCSEASLAKAQAELKSARGQHDDSEVRRLNDALSQAQANLTKRQAELAEMQNAADDALARAARNFDHKLAQAKEEWAAQETSKLAEAKSEWKTNSDRLFKQATIRLEGAEAALAEARAAASTAQDRREGAELKRLRTEFAAAREKLAERESELAEAKVAAGRERERNRGDVESALAKAEESWKAAEAVRIAEVETREQERGTRALAEAMGRLERTEAALKETRVQLGTERERGGVALAESRAQFEKTESALQEARNRIETMRDPANETELARMRADLATLQVAIDERDAELAEARVAARRSRDEWNTRIQAAVMRGRDEWRTEEDRRMEAARRQWENDARLKGSINLSPETFAQNHDHEVEEKKDNRLAIDIALAAALAIFVVGGVTLYPRISGFLTGIQGGSPIGMTKATASVQPQPPATPALPHGVIVVSSVKLRASPTGDAHAITTIARGVDVTLVGQRGNWMHVRIAGEAGKPPSDGWVHSSSLKQTPAPAHKN
jgi:hypothetical protein